MHVSKLLTFPNELLNNVLRNLEYASEVNAFAQTCTRFHDVSNSYLYTHYARECSRDGLFRVIENKNAEALQKLLSAGIWFHLPLRASKYNLKQCPRTPVCLATRAGPRMLRILLDYIATFVPDSSDATYATRLWDSVLAHVECGLASRPNDYYEELEIINLILEMRPPGVLEGSHKLLLGHALEEAAERGNLSLIKGLVKTLVEDLGANVNDFQDDGITAINLAAKNGHLDVVEYLLEQGIDLDLPLHFNVDSSPLAFAAFHGQTQVEEYLVDHGAHLGPSEDIDIRFLISSCLEGKCRTPASIMNAIDWAPLLRSEDPQKRSDAFNLAVSAGDETLVRQLLRDGYGYFEEEFNDWSAVCLAAMCGFASITKTLFETMVSLKPQPEEVDGIRRRQRGPQGWRNWHARTGHEIIMFNPEILLPLFEEYIIELELSAGMGTSPHQVCLDKLGPGPGHPATSKYFLDRGLGFFTEPKHILWELFYAFEAKDHACVETILRHTMINPLELVEVELPETTREMRSVLQIAASLCSFEELTSFLTLTGLVLDSSDTAYQGALAAASQAGQPEIVRYFLDNGFDVNQVYALDTDTKDRLLYLATCASDGLPLQSQQKSKQTIQEDNLKVMRVLIDYGADLEAVGDCGKTALGRAVHKRSFEECQLLIDRGANPMTGHENNTSAIQAMIEIISQEIYNWRYVNGRTDDGSPGLRSVADALFKLMSDEDVHCPWFKQAIIDFSQCLLLTSDTKRISKGTNVVCGRYTGGFDDLPPPVCWDVFFCIKAMRRRYWRAQFPVPDLVRV